MITDQFIRLTLQACLKTKDLRLCQNLHSVLFEVGFHSNLYLLDLLILLYSACGALEDANHVFSIVPKPTTNACNAIIKAYAKVAKDWMVITMFNHMQVKGSNPNKFTFLCVLKACKDTVSGRLIHHLIVKNGLNLDLSIANAIISMYIRCERVEEAQKVFDVLQLKDVTSWCNLINGYSTYGNHTDAILMFEKMQQNEVHPNVLTFLGVLRACSNVRKIVLGKQIHDQITRNCLDADFFISSALVNVYAKCGALHDAHSLFTRLPKQNPVSWGVMITAYVDHDKGMLALQLFKGMVKQGLDPTRATFLAVLKVCGNLGTCVEGMLTHHYIISNCLEDDMMVASSIIDMYAKCCCLTDACKVFKYLPHLDVVSWGVMIDGYAENNQGNLALILFENMLQMGILSNKPIFLSSLKACGSEQALKSGRIIHGDIIRSALELDSTISTSLVDMYAKCGSLEEARRNFDAMPERTVVTWSALISGYAEHDCAELALELFREMKLNGINPDKVTFSSILKACSSLNLIGHGTLVHEEIRINGLQTDVIVGTALVDMYSKCGEVEVARTVFDEMPIRNTLSWGAMISGYAQHGYGFSALELFQEMHEKGIKPNKVTFLCILRACSSIGMVVHGRWIHSLIIRNGCECVAAIANTLVGMYAKCGSLIESCKVFSAIQNPDVVSWAALITGYAQHGIYKLAMECIEVMDCRGVMPNGAIFASLLAACSHSGVIGEGCQSFHNLREDHYMVPGFEQYSCMIDLFGRGGHLSKAEDVFRTMPSLPNFIATISFLTHCRNFSNVMGKQYCGEATLNFDINNNNQGCLISNIVSDVEVQMDKKNYDKTFEVP